MWEGAVIEIWREIQRIERMDKMSNQQLNEMATGVMYTGQANVAQGVIPEQQLKQAKDEFHAKQQYADFVKAAMQAVVTGLYSNPETVGWSAEQFAKEACDLAEATLEEMIRRGK